MTLGAPIFKGKSLGSREGFLNRKGLPKDLESLGGESGVVFGMKDSIEQDILRLQIFYLSRIKTHLGIKNKEAA